MAAETKLTVGVDVDGARKLDQLARKIRKLEDDVTRLGMKSTRVFQNYGRTMEDTLGKSTGKWKRHFDDLDSLIKKFGTATLGGLKLALKAAGAEMALMAVSMVTLHGLFKVGQGLVKTYEGLLNVLSGAAAGATVALAGMAAALREQNAAMFAFRGSAMQGYDGFVTGLNKARVVIRGLHRDQVMAAAGAANLQAAFAAVSSTSTFNTGSQSMLRELMNFAAVGPGGLDKGMKAAGNLIAALQEGKGNWKSLAKDLMGESISKDAMKGVTDAADFQRKLLSGDLAKAGGVQGQWGAVSGTLISQFKAAFTIISADFADLGQSLLGPLKTRLDELVKTFRSGMDRVWLPLLQFGHGPFMESITGFADKVTDMFISLVRRGPEVEGMFERIADRWRGFVDGWNNVLDRLRPLIDGARVLETMFGNLFGEIGRYLKESVKRFNELVQDNAPAVEMFGTRLGELFASFGRFQKQLKEMFFTALPFINKIISGVRQVVDMLGSVLRGASGMIGALGDGAGAYGLLASAMIILSKLRSWAGGFIFQKQTQVMNVQAGTVNVGGQPATGVTAGGQMPLSERNKLEQRGMKSMSFRQRRMSAMLEMNEAAAAGGKSPTFIQRNFGSRLRAARMPTEQWRKNVAGSVGVRGGLGMGLGMLSSAVGPESSGIVGLGAAASFANPFIGAGIAGLGLAHTSESRSMATLGGVGGGAALGSYLGPYGALGGAMIGGIYGAIMSGARKAARQRKEAAEAGEALSAVMFASITSALENQMGGVGGGGAGLLTVGSLRQRVRTTGFGAYARRIHSANASNNQNAMAGLVNELRQDPRWGSSIPDDLDPSMYGQFLTGLANRNSRDQSSLNQVFDNTSRNVFEVGAIFNKGEEGILRMAAATDTELYSATMGWGYMAQQLAKGLINNYRELQNAQADMRSGIQSDLRRTRDRLGAPKSLDEAGQNIRNILMKDGALSMEDQANVADEYANMYNYMVSITGSETMAARNMQMLFGQGGSAFGSGQMFGGLESRFAGVAGIGQARTGTNNQVTSQRMGIAEILLSGVIGAGVAGGSMPEIYRQLAAGGNSNADWEKILEDPQFFRDEDMEWLTAAGLQQKLKSFGINLDLRQMTEAELTAPQDKFEGAVEAFVGGVNDLIGAISDMGNGDTATPRRNMVRMNQMLGRSRNSDHRFGEAFDMYGSGLGSQMTAIRNAGGYADMHGSGRRRHLHAVPGQAMPGGGENNHYTINVVGGDNASPAEIADEVMDRIARRSVDSYERT